MLKSISIIIYFVVINSIVTFSQNLGSNNGSENYNQTHYFYDDTTNILDTVHLGSNFYYIDTSDVDMATFIKKFYTADSLEWHTYPSNDLDTVSSDSNFYYIDTNDVDMVAFIKNFDSSDSLVWYTYLDDSVLWQPENTSGESYEVFNESIPFIIYPNPANTFVNLQIELKEKQGFIISIYNCFGQKVFEEAEINKTGNFSKQINVSNLDAGIYIVNISISSNNFIKKLIKL